MVLLRQLVDVPSTDPDDARRRKLLNVLLLGLVPLTLLVLVAVIVVDITGLYPPDRILVLYISFSVALVALLMVVAINRWGAGWLASAIFLTVIVVACAFIDEPKQVVAGRSLIAFALPITIASVLVRPSASFTMAGLSSVIIVIMAVQNSVEFDPIAPLTFFAIAFSSWLSARTMERAIRDLRVLNIELEDRVRDRTRDLAESLSKNEAILDGIADGVIVFDDSRRAIAANPAAGDLLGQSASGMIGQGIQALMGRDVRQEDRELILRLLRERQMELPSVKVEWGSRTLSLSVAPVRLESGEDVGAVAVLRDFTREAEIDRMKSGFVSTASHELRTPLNAVLGYVDMLQEGVYGELSDRQQGPVRRLAASTGHLLGLVNNLLDQAQLEAGTLRLTVQPFQLQDLIDDVKTVMGVLVETKGLELVSEVEAGFPATLLGDRQRLHQILTNLVGNAVKFTPEGSVTMRVYQPDDEHWALAVTDTGPGISMEAQQRIFERFRHADDSLTREHTGAGLGLSIVRDLVEVMGGEIVVESQVGKGSTFTVILPMVPPGNDVVARRAEEMRARAQEVSA